MKVAFVYPTFDRHADSHPELRECVPCDEYVGPPSLGIASVAANTPPGWEISFIDDRVTPFDPDAVEADVYALSFFTPAASRGLEIGDALLARGKTVVMGGIFPSLMPDAAGAHASSVVVGEGEAVWPQLLDDVRQGRLQPRYASGDVDLSDRPPPRVDLYLDAEHPDYGPDDYPLQLSRGCPLKCEACALPHQMGRCLRFVPDAHVDHVIRELAGAGKHLSLTEDTSITFINGARRHFRAFLERLRAFQVSGLDVKLSYLGISMPMLLHLPRELFEALSECGMDRFYVVGGFDPVTRGAFGWGDERRLAQAELAVRRCQDHGLDPYVSFLVGNEGDDEGVFDRMLEFCQRVDLGLAEFCVATPYPGTWAWKRLLLEDRIFDFTWRRYNDANVVFEPKQMSPERLHEGYLGLWKEFYRGRTNELTERSHIRRTVQF